MAAQYGQVRVLDLLLESGVDPELKDGNNETAIFAAVRANQTKALRCLLGHGVVWDGKNRVGKTPKWVAKNLKYTECVAILEWRQPLHLSSGVNVSISSATESGYGGAPGAGLFLDVHIRLAERQWLTTEFGYTIRGTEITGSDEWVEDNSGSPYYEYSHLDISPRLNWAFSEAAISRWYGIFGGEYRLQAAADIRTDSELWDPIDVSDRLESSGLAMTFGLGFSRFTTGGYLLGMELRRSMTLSGEWTSAGGGLNSWVLVFRFGS